MLSVEKERRRGLRGIPATSEASQLACHSEPGRPTCRGSLRLGSSQGEVTMGRAGMDRGIPVVRAGRGESHSTFFRLC